MKALSISFLISIFLLIGLLCSYTNAANFEIQNNCAFNVWAASVPIGGGRRLDRGQVWNINVPAGTKRGRIWARTGCKFDANGRGRCQTGDCNGVLQCNAFGVAPNTLAEYALNQFNNLDFFDISLAAGFNVPMDFSPVGSTPTSSGCNLVEYSGNEYIGDNVYISLGDGVNEQMEVSFATVTNTAYGQMQVNSNSEGCTHGIKCSADINGQCPDELRAPGGCNDPCTVFKTDEYCCDSGNCRPTSYSKFFKDRCPDAYTYPKDDQTSTFTCPGGTSYRVVFCP